MDVKKKIVILTGAGIDVESGLAAFRTANGLWENHKVEDVADIRGWKKDREVVLNFYNERRDAANNAQPNKAHLALAELEDKFDVQIVTTNVSSLHERAGSSKVLHLHGELSKICSSHDKRKTLPYTEDIKIGDKHPDDGSQLRPFIVWFGEDVPLIEEAAMLCHDADIFIVIGTSLSVYPAAGLLQYVRTKDKFVVDTVIPEISNEFIKFKSKATVGVPKLVKKLMLGKNE